MVAWLIDLLREALRRRLGPVSIVRFLRGQAGIRLRSLFWELRGAVRDLRGIRRAGSDLLLVVHADRLRPGGFIELAQSDLCARLIADAGATPVHSRLGYRLRSGRATRAFSVEPFTGAPPVRFSPRHASAVLVADTWSKAWMARHLTRNRADVILTPYLWPVRDLPALRRTDPSRWRLFPWWVPDRAVDGRAAPTHLRPEVVVVGAAGPMYDLRMWAAEHPLVSGFIRASGYDPGATRLDGEGYFDLLSRQSAVIVAFGTSEELRVPVAKHLEVPACGALLIAARAHHLDEMGFRDGLNCIMFEGREDLGPRLQAFLDHPEAHVAIAARGLELVRQRHTTSVRLRELLEVLEG